MRAGRLRSRAVIRRPVEERGYLGAVETTYRPVMMAWTDIRPPRRLIANYGAGEVPAGTMEAEMRGHIDVQMRDAIEIVAGPEAGTRWRVVSPPHRPGDGSLLILLEVLEEEIPEAPEQDEPEGVGEPEREAEEP